MSWEEVARSCRRYQAARSSREHPRAQFAVTSYLGYPGPAPVPRATAELYPVRQGAFGLQFQARYRNGI